MPLNLNTGGRQLTEQNVGNVAGIIAAVLHNYAECGHTEHTIIQRLQLMGKTSARQDENACSVDPSEAADLVGGNRLPPPGRPSTPGTA